MTAESSEDSNTLMILVPAIIVGVLVLVIGGMIVRYTLGKRGQSKAIKTEDIKAVNVKTDVIDRDVDNMDIEPQFVMDADDTKNIFGRASTAGLTSAIEQSDQKKPRKAKKKKSRKPVKPSTADGLNLTGMANSMDNVKEEDDESLDDGFRNHSDA